MKRYLITGGTSGIGEAIVKVLHAHGSHVTVLARRAPKTSKLANVDYIAVDLSRHTETLECLAELKRSAVAYDGVISNAGLGLFGQLENHDADRISETIHLNLTSHILLARALLPGMKQRGSGTFIFMGSRLRLRGEEWRCVLRNQIWFTGLSALIESRCCRQWGPSVFVKPRYGRHAFFRWVWFGPGKAEGQHLTAEDVARTVWHMLSAPEGVVIDEVSMSPQNKVVVFDRSKR